MKHIRFHYVRHGQTRFNTIQRMQGWADSPLTEKGMLDAREARKDLENVALKKAFSSSSGRCIETAKIILEGREIPLIPMDGLREVHFGSFEGLLIPEHQEEIDAIRFGDYDWTAYGGEDLAMVRKRLKETYEAIYDASEDGDEVLIVSHGAVFLHMTDLLFGLDKQLYQKTVRAGDPSLAPCPNGYAAVFEREGTEYRMLELKKRDPEFLQKLLDTKRKE